MLADHPTARRIGQGGQLADVTPFIARRTDLSPTVRTAVSAGGDVHRLDGTPLRPSTLGRPGPRVVPMAPGQGGRTAGPRVVPRAVPDNRPGAPGTPRVVPSNPNPDRYGRRYQTGDRGGAPRPDSGPRVVPSNPDRGRPADRRQQNDRGGAPRPDSGPRVVPSNPTPDRGRPADRGQQNDRGGAPRPDSGPRVVPSNPNRERPADRGQQNDRGNTNNDRPQRARPAPENDRTPPPARLQTCGGDNPGYRAPQGRSDRSYGYGNDRGYQRPAYDPPRVVAPRYTPPPAPRAARPAPPPRRQSPPPAPPQHKEKQRDNRDHGDGH